MGGLFGKKKHAEEVAKAEADHAKALEEWRREVAELPPRRQAAAHTHADSEAKRVAALEAARAQYAEEYAAREAEAAAQNGHLDELIANLGYGTAEAVQEYVSIVLSNSVYPEYFVVTHEFTFDSSTAELRLRALVPGPDTVPEIKAYKYTRSTDEITTTSLAQKACKDRYAGAVHAVALRSLHEVFEADRRGLIQNNFLGGRVKHRRPRDRGRRRTSRSWRAARSVRRSLASTCPLSCRH